MADQARCKKHPSATAGWTCNWCHAPLCPDCVAIKFAGGASAIEQCCLCGGQAGPILRKRTEISYLQRLPGALVFPFSKSGLLTILAAGFFVYFLRLLGLRGAMLAQALLWTYVFSLIRSASLGKKEIEPPDITGLGDIFGPAFHGGLATMIVWLPALLYGIWGRPAIWPEPPQEYDLADFRAGRRPGGVGMPGLGGPGMPVVPGAGTPEADLGEPGEEGLEPTSDEPPDGEGAATGVAGARRADGRHAGPAAFGASTKPQGGPPPLHRDPFLWLILLFGVLYAPMALTIAAVGGSWLDMLSPFRVFMAIRRIPGDYLVLVCAAGGLVAMMAMASIVGGLIGRIPIPIIPGWFAGMLATYPALVAGHAFGLLLYVRGSEIGYLPPGDAFEQTGNAGTPRGTPPSEVSAAQAAQQAAVAVEGPPAVAGSAVAARFAPIGLAAAAATGGAPAPAASAASRYAPISLDDFPAVEAPQPPVVPVAQALQQALAAKDLARVAQLYVGAQEPLPAALHFDVGRVAGGAGNHPLALQALKAVVQVAPQDPLAPKALVLAARVYGDRMGDATTAARIYAHVVARYPGTEAAAFAQQRLAAAPRA